jgi:hypothetical protein
LALELPLDPLVEIPTDTVRAHEPLIGYRIASNRLPPGDSVSNV